MNRVLWTYGEWIGGDEVRETVCVCVVCMLCVAKGKIRALGSLRLWLWSELESQFTDVAHWDISNTYRYNQFVTSVKECYSKRSFRKKMSNMHII